MIFSPEVLIIHCSATVDGVAANLQAIRRWHRGEHPDSPYRNSPMSDVGYHWVVEYLNGEPEIFMGRLPNAQGAHCKGWNSNSLGVCVVGNFDVHAPSSAVWNKTVSLCSWILQRFNIKYLKGHREINPNKTCPGKLFDLDRFRHELGCLPNGLVDCELARKEWK